MDGATILGFIGIFLVGAVLCVPVIALKRKAGDQIWTERLTPTTSGRQGEPTTAYEFWAHRLATIDEQVLQALARSVGGGTLALKQISMELEITIERVGRIARDLAVGKFPLITVGTVIGRSMSVMGLTLTDHGWDYVSTAFGHTRPILLPVETQPTARVLPLAAPRLPSSRFARVGDMSVNSDTGLEPALMRIGEGGA